jgi:hypothetical protein
LATEVSAAFLAANPDLENNITGIDTTNFITTLVAVDYSVKKYVYSASIVGALQDTSSQNFYVCSGFEFHISLNATPIENAFVSLDT